MLFFGTQKHVFHKNTKQYNCFNIDNNKSFLSSKSAHWNDFCRIMWYWKFSFVLQE